MEVYQSSKTAAEMEFALGAVPSIGANGNWFIGEQDTGIFAAGVNVSGAEPGQIVKVSEVDENGRPLAWEACKLEGGDKWELIFDVYSGDTDLTCFCVTEDSEGNPIDLKAALLFARLLPAIGSGTQKTSYVKFGFNSRVTTGTSNPIKTSGCPSGWTQQIYTMMGLLLPDGVQYHDIKSGYNNAMANALGYASGLGPAPEYVDISTGKPRTSAVINGISVGGYEAVVGAGSRFILYGVRK